MTSESGDARPGWAKRIATVIVRIGDIFGVVIMATMTLLLVTQVLVRYLLPIPLFWIEEVARLGMIWMTMVGAGYAVGRGIHLTVTALTDRLPAVALRWLKQAVLVLLIAVAALLAPAAWELVGSLGSVTASSSNIPRSVYFLASVIGYGLVVIQAALGLFVGPIKDKDSTDDALIEGGAAA